MHGTEIHISARDRTIATMPAARRIRAHGAKVKVSSRRMTTIFACWRGHSEGLHPWTVAEVEQFEACYPIGSKARLALALLMYTGVRRSDVVKLGRQHVRDGWITIAPQKNRRHK